MDPLPVSSTFQSMEDFEKEFGLEPSPAHPSSSTNNANNVTMTDAPAPTSSTFQTMQDFEKEFTPQPYKQSKQQLSLGFLPSPALSAQYSGGTGTSTPMSFVQRPQDETVNWVGLLMGSFLLFLFSIPFLPLHSFTFLFTMPTLSIT